MAKVREILEHTPALVDSKGKQDWTPLLCAVASHHNDVAEILLSKGAHAAKGYVEMVRLLLANKADVNAGTLRGYTALSAAAYYGNEALVLLLLQSGANVNAVDADGSTPLHWARKNDHQGIEVILRQYGGYELLGRSREWPYP